MSATVTTWRRRCLAAEDRATTAERSARRWQSKAERAIEEGSALYTEHKSLLVHARAHERVILRLAVRHLGPDTTIDEAKALANRWFEVESKRSVKHKAVLIRFANEMSDEDVDRLMKRLFGKGGDA
jgi:hypothetical protein